VSREVTWPLLHQAGEREPSSEAAEAAAGGGGGGGVAGPGRAPKAAAGAGRCHRVGRVHEPRGDHAEEPAPVRAHSTPDGSREAEAGRGGEGLPGAAGAGNGVPGLE
jgi:hypothetical protein